MAKFRSKPREITAEQYTEYGKPVTGMCQSISCHSVNHEPHVHTMHNNQIVFLVIGDWVTPEPDGEHYYPIKPDVMADKYEQIDLVRCQCGSPATIFYDNAHYCSPEHETIFTRNESVLGKLAEVGGE